jgi:hypothetical protein
VQKPLSLRGARRSRFSLAMARGSSVSTLPSFSPAFSLSLSLFLSLSRLSLSRASLSFPLPPFRSLSLSFSLSVVLPLFLLLFFSFLSFSFALFSSLAFPSPFVFISFSLRLSFCSLVRCMSLRFFCILRYNIAVLITRFHSHRGMTRAVCELFASCLRGVGCVAAGLPPHPQAAGRSGDLRAVPFGGVKRWTAWFKWTCHAFSPTPFR